MVKQPRMVQLIVPFTGDKELIKAHKEVYGDASAITL
jgi:hypothetical protein